MTLGVASIGRDRISFLNRDHIDSRSPDRSVASPCDQCSLPDGVPARRVVAKMLFKNSTALSRQVAKYMNFTSLSEIPLTYDP
jgi:hypothetical protein